MKKILIIVACFVITAAVGLYWFLIASSHAQLDRLLQAVAMIELGKTTLPEWRRQVEHASISDIQFSCRQQICNAKWRKENTLLYKLKLAPPTVADVSIRFTNNTADDVYVLLVTAKQTATGIWRDDVGVVVRESSDDPSACHPHMDMSRSEHYRGTSSWIAIAMDRCVSAAERARAFAINGGCIARIGGCKTAEQIIPGAYRTPY
jgi:hypothetical protein